MAVISRGFGARRRESDPHLPPGQYLTEDFPVLSAGPTPHVDLDDWRFALRSERGDEVEWTWDEFLALPIEDVHTDIHCVTRWSKLGTQWRGVSLDTLFEDVDTDVEYAMAHSYGGYTTNVPLEDLTGVKRAWRGRGIAGALKRTQMRWAKEHGYERLSTNNEERNEPIRRLNERYGYRPAPGRIFVRGPVA